MFEHGVPLSPPPADPSPGYLEYLPVQEQDDQQGHVERGTRGEYLVPDVLADHTPLLDVDSVQIVRVFPAELRGQGHYERHTPHHDDHADYSPAISRVYIIDVGDSPIPATRKRIIARHEIEINKRGDTLRKCRKIYAMTV